VVLAAGEGTRLAPLTRVLYGYDLPKQFASFQDGRSLLQDTLERIAPLIPSHRTVVVVGAAHHALACDQLTEYPGIDVVAQPKNLDTAPGILLPLSRIVARDPHARVVIFPSDHYIPNPDSFLAAVEEAASVSYYAEDVVTLLGAEPDRPETEYGWIVPGASLAGQSNPRLTTVRTFVEKPDRTVAEQLYREAALWNTFVSAGRLSAYWDLTRSHLPLHTSLFECYAQSIGGEGEGRVARFVYARLTPANFSREVLERADRLAVLPVAGSDWCDWGSPGRIFRSLDGTPLLGELRDRMVAVQRRLDLGLASTAAEPAVEPQ
jgi:mannose-1-phosphate guanylyltransferase